MDELEHKLRSALTEMAEEVAPSHHAWAEHQRRISARKSRRPFLIAAVAAAVVALIAVPVMVLQIRTDRIQVADSDSPPRPSTPTTTDSSSPPPSGVIFPPAGVYKPQAGETVITQPVPVMYDESGTGTMVYTTQRDGKRLLCLAQVAGPTTNVVINGPAGSACTPLSPPRSGKYVWGSRLVTSPVQNGANAQMLYVAGEPTDHLLVRKTDGTYGKASRIAQGTDFSVFTVYLGSNNPPAAYTARDRASVTLENG